MNYPRCSWPTRPAATTYKWAVWTRRKPGTWISQPKVAIVGCNLRLLIPMSHRRGLYAARSRHSCLWAEPVSFFESCLLPTGGYLSTISNFKAWIISTATLRARFMKRQTNFCGQRTQKCLNLEGKLKCYLKPICIDWSYSRYCGFGLEGHLGVPIYYGD